MTEKKPEWLRVKYNPGAVNEMAQMMKDLGLNTVCREANCPNIGECFKNHTATFMVLGDRCTRDCKFCNVTHGMPMPPDENEPSAVAEAVRKLRLHHVVVTTVTRDDLDDGGASHFAALIEEIRRVSPGTVTEVLVSDMKGDRGAVDTVLKAHPDVFGHNVETVRRMYEVRPGAELDRSLGVLRYAKEKCPDILVKTGFMVGLGETDEEVSELLGEIRATGCDIVTIGQYLRPTKNHTPLDKYVSPEQFEKYAEEARSLGFKGVVSSPLARSSYHASESFDDAKVTERR